jgi:hypothetical protein
VDGIGLLLDQVVNAVLLLLVHLQPMGSEPPLGCLRRHLAIFETLLYSVLLKDGER